MPRSRDPDVQLADKNDYPQITEAQPKVADVVTTATTQTTPFGFATQAQGDALVARVNTILLYLERHGLMKDA